MSRETLPQTQANPVASAFYPSLQREMNRLLDQFKSGIPMLNDAANPLMSGALSGPAFPAIDVVETDDAFDISAEVPGVKETDLDVSISGQILTLKGEKSADREKTEDSYHLIERQYGSFRRQIPLGFSPDEGAVEAKFSDGILKLHIAKPAATKAQVKKIKISKD